MATPSEILIPVRRRHEDTRAQIEDAVTQKQQWGYAEDEDLLFIRRKNKARRYFSRSQLFRPNSAYQPEIIVDDTDIQLNHNAYYDGSWRRYSVGDSWTVDIGLGFRVAFGATGPAGGVFTPQRTLDISAAYFWINPARAASDFVVSSVVAQDSLNINGGTGHVGIGTAANASWDSTFNVIQILNNGGYDAAFATDGVYLYTLYNAYYDGVLWHTYSGVGSGWRAQIDENIYEFHYGVYPNGGGLDWTNLLKLDGQNFQVIVNEDQELVSFKIEGNNYETLFFTQPATDCVGIHTSNPLNNVGGSNGDFAQYGYGLHINTPDSESLSLCIIEGGQMPDGISPVAAGLILCDQDQSEDEKMVLFACGNGRAKFASLADDQSSSFSYTVDNILVMDLANGFIGIGCFTDGGWDNSFRVMTFGGGATEDLYKNTIYSDTDGTLLGAPMLGFVTGGAYYDETDGRWEHGYNSQNSVKMEIGNLLFKVQMEQSAGAEGTAIDYNDHFYLDRFGLYLYRYDNNTSPLLLSFRKQKEVSGVIQAGADNDMLGNILFGGYNDDATPELIGYSQILATILDASDGVESGTLDFYTYDGGTSIKALGLGNHQVFMDMTTNDITWADCPSNTALDTVSGEAGYITIDAGGQTRYIQLYDTLPA